MLSPFRFGPLPRIAVLTVTLISCKGNQPAAQTSDATAAVHNNAPAAAASSTAPENLLLVLRGTTLRRAIPLLFPQGGTDDVLDQVPRQLTPGVTGHGHEIDPDSPFAVAGTMGGTDESSLTLSIAWPLKPGMQIAQDARNLQGYRLVSEGIYAPTSRSPDGGTNAEHQCWVAKRPTVGWMLLCGPRSDLPLTAGYLRERASNPPDNAAVLDLDVRTAQARRLASHQIAELDRNQVPRAAGGVEAARRALFDQARRTLQLFASLANDAETLRGTLTQDENAMHLQMDLVFSHLTSDKVRSLVEASAGRQASTTLVQRLPAAVQAWIAGGFDRARIVDALGGPDLDPAVAMQAGPEMARVMGAVDEIKSLTPFGERIDGYSTEDGYTMYHVVRRPDAVQFVNNLRVIINSVPNRALPQGGTLRDLIMVLPTVGLTGTNVLRIGRNPHVPPGVQVSPEVQAILQRSMLVVAENDVLTSVLARDPVARYREMSQGPRLGATIPANAALSGRITPASFPPLLYGTQLPGLPESRTTETLDFTLRVERRGEGARAELRADAPIGTAMEIRQIYAMIQAMQAQMAQQMMQQQQQQQQLTPQRGAGAHGAWGAPRTRPRIDPNMLPEPPPLQLRPPQ